MTIDHSAVSATLTAAKLWVIGVNATPGKDSARNQPYLAVALFSLPTVFSDQVRRMTVDRHWRLYVNPEWVAAKPVPVVGRELAHLLWHLLADHSGRAASVGVSQPTSAVWTAAADAAIADVIDVTGLRPRRLTDANKLGLPYDGTLEEHFAALMPRREALELRARKFDCGSGADGIDRDHELAPDAGTPPLSRLAASALRRQVAIEFRTHSRGDGRGGAARWATTILDPTTAWESLLANAVRRAVTTVSGRGDYTYRRPSRRSTIAQGVILPGQHRPVPQLAVVVDTSASVNDTLLGRALGEVDSLIMSLGLGEPGVTLISVDTVAHVTRRVRRVRDAAVAGAGGTDMRVGIGAALEQKPRPEVVVVFTDGYTPWPDAPPSGVSVVVALLGAHGQSLPPTPDWVSRVECRADR
ncbi:conserved hypothetical protein [Rhodococcus sp. RD6.2]|uniref:vWA domain-containing protein n=1 Tax=Rhodococcus sp. RD6.2 TaxID=260936 RepID=UPI00063B60BE|nr:VWA-like domain-containing protein [Rhodococcus sp. RD6.2]CRK51988.1 conserved hypothetical protein [Rhodococcus sp. RD6.2]